MTTTLNEQFTRVGDIELCYETFGEPGDPAVLLIMGLGTQMLAWHADFCRALAARGFFVIRYDNRDVGRSTRFDHVPPPTARQILTRRPRHVPYTLVDMADDVAGLLDNLGIDAAHIVGASMGGMIAQVFAARHPQRTLSLASIMSTTGSRWKGQPALRVYPFFVAKPPRTKEQYVESLVKLFRVVGSPGFERDDEELREMAALSWDRGPSPAGLGRQLAAIISAGDRTLDVGRITAPTVVIHGRRDRLVRKSGGKATARAIPGAKLVLIKGMGHDLPRGAWPQIIDAITRNAADAKRPAAASAAA
ncbi:MAG: alpha/beta hydrolase [Actinobacteria bacterium]|nr:MAG: alpha/beta hydrolase [Actinomycetota bacterium]